VTTVNMHQAKTELPRLVARALAGEEVIIARDGEAVVRLVHIRMERIPGSARGSITFAAGADAPLPEVILATFEGRG